MSIRIRAAIAIAAATLLVTAATAVAKGGFDFITITGPNLKESVRVTDIALTEDFFTFANFYEDRTKPPANPGEGYEITRYYVDGKRDIVFDRLHYYPETGFVFYDGIENGESEYDGGWYTANSDIRPLFESALFIPAEKKQPLASVSQSENSIAQPSPVALDHQSLTIVIITLGAGLAALAAFAFWRRKPADR